MAQTRILTGTSHTIPETGEKGWGAEVTAALLDIIRLLNGTFQDVTGIGATTIDVTAGHNITLTLTDDATVGFSNTRAGDRYVLLIVQGGAGSNIITWSDTIKWRAGGVAPVLTTDIGGLDIVTILMHPTLGLIGSYDKNFK